MFIFQLFWIIIIAVAGTSPKLQTMHVFIFVQLGIIVVGGVGIVVAGFMITEALHISLQSCQLW